MSTRTYLGDGVYAEFDGYMVTLRADSGGQQNVIHLESAVLGALDAWRKSGYVDYDTGQPRDHAGQDGT